MTQRRPWTEADLAYLRERYASTPTDEMAWALGRPVGSVHRMAAKLQLRKSLELVAAMARERSSMTQPTSSTVQARIDTWLRHRAAIRDSRTRLGMVGYAHLAAMLVQQPDTVLGLMQRAGLGHVAAYRFLGTLKALNYAHVVSWVMSPGGPPKPVWAFGPGADAPAPSTRPNGRAVTGLRLPRRQLSAGVLHFVSLLRAIEVPASLQEVVTSTGLHREPVDECLRALVGLELAHVPLWMARWQGGAPLPQYQLGRGRNAPKPVRVLRSQRHELEMERQRARRQAAPQQAALMAFMQGRQGQEVSHEA